jgi:hypothetical protein
MIIGIFFRILCRHILVIFQAKSIIQIPSHFILRRWTKDANKGIETCYTKSNFDGQTHVYRFKKDACSTRNKNISWSYWRFG